MRSAHIWSVSEPPKWASHPQPGSLRKKSREINNSARASFPPHFCFLSAPSLWRLSQINPSCASNYFSFQNFSHGWIRAPYLLTADSLNARYWKHHVLGGEKTRPGLERDVLGGSCSPENSGISGSSCSSALGLRMGTVLAKHLNPTPVKYIALHRPFLSGKKKFPCLSSGENDQMSDLSSSYTALTGTSTLGMGPKRAQSWRLKESMAVYWLFKVMNLVSGSNMASHLPL